MNLQRIELSGKALSMVGVGRMHTRTGRMELTLISGSPRELPSLPLLEELLEGASRELLEVRVTGSLDAPRVEARPLRSLDQTLRSLLNPAPPRRWNR